MSYSMLTALSNKKPRVFLPISGQNFTLMPNRIDIWEYPLETLWPDAEFVLNDTERERAKRYHFPRHRRRFTIARAMLRLILGQYLNIPSHLLTFDTNDFGKPYINSSLLKFNLSHSKDLALLAIGHTHDLGVDLEYFSSRPLKGLSEIMFSPKEIQAFSQCPPQLRTLSFFHVWAQKEAFIKANGMGLSYPTQSFDVSVMSPSSAPVYDSKHQLVWHIQSFMPAAACCAAICHHPNIQTIRYRKLSKEFHVTK